MFHFRGLREPSRLARPPWAGPWQPLLAGAGPRDRILAGIGAMVGIALVAAVSTAFGSADAAMLVAPIGASAVLLFAIPSSPLSQPWPVIGGNIVSALAGLAAAKFVPGFWAAAGAAVGGAILLMSLLRCLHPPGGGTALLGVLGGSSVSEAGFAYALAPVGLNAVLLVGAGWLFHLLSGHSYPHRAGVPVGKAGATPTGRHFRGEDIDTALLELGETFDIDREDLRVLLNLAEQHARKRSG